MKVLLQMPLKKLKAVPDKPVLENGTYICSAFNPRCFIIQKVNKKILSISLIKTITYVNFGCFQFHVYIYDI